jgi:hypothetical protein
MTGTMTPCPCMHVQTTVQAQEGTRIARRAPRNPRQAVGLTS